MLDDNYWADGGKKTKGSKTGQLPLIDHLKFNHNF